MYAIRSYYAGALHAWLYPRPLRSACRGAVSHQKQFAGVRLVFQTRYSTQKMKRADGVPARRQGIGAFPLGALKVNQVPQEHRFAVLEIEAVAAEAPARRNDHALGSAFRHLNVSYNFV